MRYLTAWGLLLIGDLIYCVFDQWLPFIGLRGPLWTAYQWAMNESCRIQADGPDHRRPGPWTMVKRG